MRIDKNLLPAKYALEVYKMVDGYPSTIDLLYEIVSVLQERDKLEQPFVALDIMKEVTSRINNDDLEVTLKALVSENWLSLDDGKYKLTKHPWL